MFFSFRILNSVYRGHIVKDASHLFAAVKIIMHTNYLHTRDHQQRTHQPMDLGLDDVEAAGAADDRPVHPEIGTGHKAGDFVVGDLVLVWYMRSWWHGKVTYKSRTGTLSVRFTGARNPVAGVLPKHVKHAEIIDE
jgi:hypothetical protein